MIDWIVKHKYLALLLPVVLLIGLASGMRFLSFENDYHMFFSDDNPQLVAFDECCLQKQGFGSFPVVLGHVEG